VAELGRLRERTAADGNEYRAQSIAILENEVAALAALARGAHGDAVRLARDAAEIERTMAPPSGPPDPIKPAYELYGEVLLAANRAPEAVTAFEQALLRTPKRTPSLLGLARAAAEAGDAATAKRAYTEVAEMPGAATGSPSVREARQWLAENP